MELIDFYRRVLPDRGMYCLVSPRMMHTWHATLDELVAATLKKYAIEANWYFATNSFNETESRKQENVVACKSLRLDIDAGAEKYAKHGDKVYETQEDAIEHVAAFSEWFGVAPSLVVSSGAGLHIYYVFCETLDPAVWQAASTALAKATRHFGLRVDTTVTTDSARILRPVGALHKSGAFVEVLEEGDDLTPVQFLAAFRALNLPKDEVRAARPALTGINRDLEGPAPIFAASSFHKATKKCLWLKDMSDAHGCVGYDEWFYTIGVMKHSVEGEQLAHDWSSGSDSYDFDTTQVKLDTWRGGPTLCATVADKLNSPRCTSCEYRNKVTTPIQLGRLSDNEAAEVKKEVVQAAAEESASFTLFGDDEDDDVSELSAAMSADAEPGEKLETLNGKSTPKDVLEAARKYDQRAKYVSAGTLPPSFPTMDALAEYCKTGLFFIQMNNKGKLVLYAYVKYTEELEDGGKVTMWKAQPLTEQPFYIQGYAHGSGQSEVLVEYMSQYDASGTPHWRTTEIETQKLYDQKSLREQFGKLGITFADAGEAQEIFKMMSRYASANLAVLRNRPATVQVQNHMGFQYLNREPVYVQGAYIVKKDKPVDTCSLGLDLRTLKRRFEMPCIPSDVLRTYTGNAFEEVVIPSARKYCEGVKLLYGRKEDALYQLGWALGVSSTYLTFFTDEVPNPDSDSMPGMGIALAFYSSISGSGKTTLQRVISEAFAHAEENKAGGDKNSGISNISLGVQLSKLGSLPYMLDEVTNNAPEEVSEMIHKISIGRDKVRAQQNGKPVERTGSWTSVTTMSTNVSQRVLLTQHRSSSNAEQMRVVELNFEGVKPGSLTDFVRSYNDYICANRGALGIVLGQYAIEHWDEMREQALDLMDRLIKRYNMPNSERYFAKIGAAALLVLSVLNRFNMQPVDLALVIAEFGKALEAARGYIIENTPEAEDYAERMVRDLMPRILRTRTETDNRGARLRGEEPVWDVVENPDIINRVKIAGRYVAATGRLYVVSSEFVNWATKLGLDTRTLLAQWTQSGIYAASGAARPKRLNGGIHKNLMPDMNPRCYTFNIGHLASLLDDSEPTANNVVDIGSATSKTAGPAPAPASDETYNEGAAE